MTIKHTVQFETTPASLYQILVSSELFSDVTGAPAKIDPVENGSLSLFGGYIVGSILELVPDQKVVQSWRSTEWPEGVDSKVCFELREDGESTTLEFEHSGFPEEMGEHLDKGWHERYWTPIREYIANS